MAQFAFELVSPEEKLISEPAFQVEIPGQEGNLGIRAGHMSLVVSLRPGIVTVQSAEYGSAQRIFVAGGFADIGQDHVTILAEEAMPVADLDRERIAQQVRDLDDDFSIAESDAERARIENRRQALAAMITAIQS
jgi:F-type H+-transporting ATPase subunit epsilon